VRRPHVSVFVEAAALLVGCEINAQHLVGGGQGPAPLGAETLHTFNASYRRWLADIRRLGPVDAANRMVNDLWFPALMESAPEVGQPLLDYWLEVTTAGVE
jgi:hypothetical protein